MSEALDKMISRAKARDFFDDPAARLHVPAKRDQTRSVKSDRLDRIAWDVLQDQVGALGDQVREAEEKHETAPAAYEDLFNLLNQGDPRQHELDRMVEKYLPNHSMMGHLAGTEEFKYIRRETKYDEYNTALAMLTMKDRMDQSLDQVQAAVDAMQAAADALAEAIANGEAVMMVPGGAGEGEVDEAMQQLAQAMAEAALADKLGEKSASEVEALMEKALQEATDAIEKEKQTMSGYGLSDGELKRMDFNERRALAERLDNTRMTNLAKLLGRFRMYADAERRRKLTAVPAEKYDVELGNDLSKMVMGEFNMLAMPETEDVFWMRWAKSGLQQWKVRGNERAGKGPIIVVCDESGSMGAQLDDEGNTREAWSKAVTLALADQAFRGKRDFIYIGFSSQNQVWELEFPKGEMNKERVIALGEHFFCGGTSYEGPIQRAGQIVKQYHERGRSTPDVVFLTDDACRVSDTFVEWWRTLREELKMSCYGLQIGGEPYANNLKDLSDHCMNIDALNAHPQGVVKLFQTI